MRQSGYTRDGLTARPGPPQAETPVMFMHWAGNTSRLVTVEREGNTLHVQVSALNKRPTARSPVQLQIGRNRIRGRVVSADLNGWLTIVVGDRPVRGHRVKTTGLEALCGRPGGQAVRVAVEDVSSSGALIRGYPAAIGDQLMLQFVPPGYTRVVTLRAEVVRRTADGCLGLAFCLYRLDGLP